MGGVDGHSINYDGVGSGGGELSSIGESDGEDVLVDIGSAAGDGNCSAVGVLHKAEIGGDEESEEVGDEDGADFDVLERGESDGAEGVDDSERVVVAGECEVLEHSSVENVLVLVDELIVTVERPRAVDEADRVVGQIQTVGELDVVQHDVEVG